MEGKIPIYQKGPLGGRFGVRQCTWLSREHSRSPIYHTGVILLVMMGLFFWLHGRDRVKRR